MRSGTSASAIPAGGRTRFHRPVAPEMTPMHAHRRGPADASCKDTFAEGGSSTSYENRWGANIHICRIVVWPLACDRPSLGCLATGVKGMWNREGVNKQSRRARREGVLRHLESGMPRCRCPPPPPSRKAPSLSPDNARQISTERKELSKSHEARRHQLPWLRNDICDICGETAQKTNPSTPPLCATRAYLRDIAADAQRIR